MLCQSCGKEAGEGKYCPYCGAALNKEWEEGFQNVDFVPEDPLGEMPDQEMVSDSTVVLEPLDEYEPGDPARRPAAEAGWEEEKPGKSAPAGWEEQRPGKRTRGAAGRTAGESAGKLPGKMAAAAGRAAESAARRILPPVLRACCVVLMAVQLIFLGREYWIQRSVLGSALHAFTDRNYAELCYMGLVFVTLLFGFLSLIWMAGRRSFSENGKVVKRDTGRGLTAFILFFLMAFASMRLAFWLPYAPEFAGGILNGVNLYLVTSDSVSTVLYVCSGLGIVCCAVRRALR